MKPWHDWNLKIPRWIVVLTALMCWPAALMGCATVLPPCERYGYSVVSDDSGAKYVMLDAENVAKLVGLIKGVAAGECRLPIDGEV